MKPRAAWVRVVFVSLLGALIAGRWIVVTVAESLWADAVGAGATYRQLRGLQSWLAAVAFASAAGWFIANLYVVYRSIGSVHVPRRMGNIEILEAVPRRHMLWGVAAIGIVLGLTAVFTAGDWWAQWMLAGIELPVGVVDPVLGRDVSYYLLRLPWFRTLHSFVLVLCAVALLVVVVLYAAMGAVRWSRRRLTVTDLARLHMALLLGALAVILFAGYRLEPAELVGGVSNVPLDTVLVNIRVPVARVLAGLALLACGASLFWIWVPRVVLVGVAWGALAAASFVGHFVAPAFAGSMRSADELLFAPASAIRDTLSSIAFGVRAPETSSIGTSPAIGSSTIESLAAAPIWDGFAIEAFLERAAPRAAHERFTDPAVQLYRDANGRLVPVFLTARTLDLSTAADSGVEMGWDRVHSGALSAGRGALAIVANSATSAGTPMFVTDMSRLDSTSSAVTDVSLRDPTMRFAPDMLDFSVVDASSEAKGVSVGGVVRRLALAWVLQSPRLLSRTQVADTSRIVWRRDVVARLERYAPFANFSGEYPVIVDDRVYWVAAGFVGASAFPGVVVQTWRDQRVRYLRSGLVGVVDAHSGEVRVYMRRSADVLTRAWARLMPEVVLDAGQVPLALAVHLRYPEALFEVQRRVATGSTGARPPRRGDAPVVIESGWWIGPVEGGDAVRLWRTAVEEAGTPPAAHRAFVATVVDGELRFRILLIDSALQIPGPTQIVRRLIQVRDPSADLHGALRLAPVAGDLVALQSSYRAPFEEGALPELRGITIARGGAVASGRTVPQAFERLGTEMPLPIRPGSWEEARRWFQRLDAARQNGDWRAFGEAYDALRRLLIVRDSFP